METMQAISYYFLSCWFLFSAKDQFFSLIQDALSLSKHVKPRLLSFPFFWIKGFTLSLWECPKCFSFWLTLTFTQDLYIALCLAFFAYLLDAAEHS